MAEAAENFEVEGDDKQKRLQERLRLIVAGLSKEAETRESKRKTIEERMLDDLRMYHGVYTPDLKKRLEAQKKSQLFINQTRPKTNALEARLSDMLFPTDDRNWDIQPTPVPELVVEAEESARRAADAIKQSVAAKGEDPTLAQRADETEQLRRQLQAEIDEALHRSKGMREEIDDHLRECKYQAESRDVIRDACKIGTGVMKGPISSGRSKQIWQLVDVEPDENENTNPRDMKPPKKEFQLVEQEDDRPKFWRTDPWHFFPDLNASRVEDSEGFFERHLLNPTRLRRLAKLPGFDANAIRRVLKFHRPKDVPSYLADLRSITGSYHETLKDCYTVWEYHGPLTGKDLMALAAALEQPEIVADLDPEDIDPLAEIEVVVWFCEDEVLMFGLHHLDSEEPIYSVFNLEKDEDSLFGFGVPYLMRDSQKALAAGWRMMLDNAGLSAGPQIVIDDGEIEPVDGDWTLVPRKVWRKKSTSNPSKKPFEVHEIQCNQADMENIINLSMQFIDVETAMPSLAQGEQGTQVTKTFQGMAILMNSVNVVFRRIVKNFDDDMTTPNIRRMYHWLMQFSPKEHIKGDYQVDARGTSVLLVKEMQSQNLMLFLDRFVDHPLLGKFLKQDGLPALRALVQTMMLPANQLIKSNEEIEDDRAEAERQPPPPDPEMEKITAQLNLEEMRGQNALDLEFAKRETALIKLAGELNWDYEKLQAELADHRAERNSRERQFAAEAAISKREGPSGGGHF